MATRCLGLFRQGETVVWGSSDSEEDVVWDRSAEEPDPRPVT